MNSGTHASVMGNRKNKAVVETVAQIVFTICAFFAVLAEGFITLYIIFCGTPAIMQKGLGEDPIGRAPWRGKGEVSGGAGVFKKKKKRKRLVTEQ